VSGFIALKVESTQSRVADYIERYREHFRDVRIESIYFRLKPEEGPLKEYEKGFVVQEILGIFDWAAVDLDRDDPGRRNFFQQLPSCVRRAAPGSGSLSARAGPKGVIMIMDEQDLWQLSFPISDIHSRYWNNYIYVTRGKFRKMKELYRQVMAEMGLIEPVSEPKEAEKVEEAQAPTDKGIEWVQAAFLNKLKTLDEDIGEDFFIFEEIEEEGLILVRGRAFLARASALLNSLG